MLFYTIYMKKHFQSKLHMDMYKQHKKNQFHNNRQSSYSL